MMLYTLMTITIGRGKSERVASTFADESGEHFDSDHQLLFFCACQMQMFWSGQKLINEGREKLMEFLVLIVRLDMNQHPW